MLPSPPSPIDQPLTQDAQPWDPWQEPLSGLNLDLVLAIQQHDLNALQRVLDQGGRPHRVDPNTWITPVALAARQNFAAAVPVLLRHGDCPWHRDCEDLNAVHYAIWRGNLDVLAGLTDGVAPEVLHARMPDGVMVALQGGHPAMVKHLLEQGWPLGTVTLNTVLGTVRTGRLFRNHDEREDGPFAPGCHERERACPLLLALIEQRLLREHLNDAPIETVRNVARSRARL